MKSLLTPELQNMHREHPVYGWGNAVGGYFVLGSLRIIVANGDDWDHISVSLADRMPTWMEMEKVKRLFFNDDEYAIQYHPPMTDYINKHANVLHMWRPHKLDVPFPPKYMV